MWKIMKMDTKTENGYIHDVCVRRITLESRKTLRKLLSTQVVALSLTEKIFQTNKVWSDSYEDSLFEVLKVQRE